MSEELKLPCPECGEPLLPPTGRGRYDDDGIYVEHRYGCRCPWCGPMWFEDDEPVKCECGALVGIGVDDETAFAKVRA